ncbi:flagellar export protein FliJ [Candidatus Contubernalis alkaliaceticus]|uniref:flagellar export protein FliJ n=1 Tax=Candidatus Contubernalis alkaliaceticus TaxID=338645 RepID=UPI001F4C1955|nr:flagellar export protein FliJ [Candidatus Contubernalis alkalaceticus]UNC91747.1 flagellar export protein FliJ [Candidatus Contubernalis alkalaceticus]
MMSQGFEFRLKKVLEYREEKVKQAQKSLTEARIILMNEEGRLSSLKDELNNVNITAKGEGNLLDLQEAITSCRYMDYLDVCICEQQHRVSEKKGVLEDKRCEILERTRERKILSTLEEKQYNLFLKDMDIKEQKLSDEFALSIYNRRCRQEK